MYGLPKNFDASPLVGRTLEMVCFNANQISLHFDKQAAITVESALTYKMASDTDVQRLIPPVAQSNIMQLTGHKIAHAVGKPDGTLSLVFDNGHIIECLDTSTHYESYQIILDGRTIIV